MTDEELARHVTDELHWNPKLDSRAIAVSAADGVVTLRGTVGSPWEKREAEKAARRVRGVRTIDDHLAVRLLDRDRRQDADVRGDVLQALMLDSRVPTTVDATADDGVVTLTGPVDRWDQREAAEFVASNVPGVAAVLNHIVLEEPSVRVSAEEVEGEIRKAFFRSASLDADNIAVTTSEGTITLTGIVRSWDELEAAVAAAWAAPGVRTVDNRLEIAY
jgi:osmotically-inducible protein OsmY